MFILRLKFLSYPIGVWIGFIALILVFLVWIMQAYSLLNWQGAVELGLQNESFTGEQNEQAMADVERGIATADIIWALPLSLIAFIGLLRNKLLGFVTANMVFAICIYFPLFYAFRESTSNNIVWFVLLLWALPSLFGIIGLWVNRKLYTTT